MKRRKCANFYHVYTKGLEDNLIFRERQDYITGMNYIALCTFISGIDMLAFSLMSNHFHFVIYGTMEEARLFMNQYKWHISRYLNKRHGSIKLLRHVKTGYKLIEHSGETLKTVIAYVLRNHIKAGINHSVQGYEWSSGHCYFAGTDLLACTVPLCDLGTREYRKLMHTKTRLNSSYRINGRGYIEPASYVNVTFVESCYGRVQSLDYFIYKAGGSRTKEGPVDFSDKLVMSGLQEILNKKYDLAELTELNDSMKRDVMMLLKRQFNCSPKQLARIMKMSLNDVAVYLSGDA